MGIILNAFTNFMTSYLDGLVAMLKSMDVIIGMSFAILGVATAFLARRITRIIRKRNDIDDNDPALITIKAVGLVFMLIAFLILVFQTIA
ncbi:MAG: hypothetical protein IJA69_01410 [Clostridia bacterium]|nr:hypothetical protein [Clostridia bacterium]